MNGTLRIGVVLALVSSAVLPRTDYVVSIENTMGHEMDFYYTDGDSVTEKLLGTVPKRDIKEFTIKSPARTNILIIERGDAMPNWSDKRPVTLKADTLVEVVF